LRSERFEQQRREATRKRDLHSKTGQRDLEGGRTRRRTQRRKKRGIKEIQQTQVLEREDAPSLECSMRKISLFPQKVERGGKGKVV